MQQVNLYQIEEPPEPVVLTFINMIKVAIGFFIVLIFISIFKFVSYYNTQIEFNSLKDKKHALNVELEKAKGQIPAKDEKEKLAQQIEELEVTATHMKKMQLILNQLQAGEAHGFSAYLEALAKYNVPELWLTAIKISSGGTLIHLEGKTTNAENVPKLLQKLGVDAAFTGKTFATFKLSTEEKEKLISFTVGSDR